MSAVTFEAALRAGLERVRLARQVDLDQEALAAAERSERDAVAGLAPGERDSYGPALSRAWQEVQDLNSAYLA